MRRFLMLAPLLLTGCSGSGFYAYERHSFNLPWQNPNRPVSGGENFQRARYGSKDTVAPLITEAGDIWPGPPAPVPTLKDLQKQEMAAMNNEGGSPGIGLGPLPALPVLPGYEISAQEVGHAPPPRVFPGTSVPTRAGRSVPLTGAEKVNEVGGTNDTPSAIVVPNGNGTSTVIGPTGNVTTIPTPKKEP